MLTGESIMRMAGLADAKVSKTITRVSGRTPQMDDGRSFICDECNEIVRPFMGYTTTSVLDTYSSMADSDSGVEAIICGKCEEFFRTDHLGFLFDEKMKKRKRRVSRLRGWFNNGKV